MAVDFSRFSNTDFSTTPFQYVIFGKNGGLLEVELNEAQYLGFIRDSIALKNIGNRCSNATITVSQNGTIATLKGDFILNGYAIHSIDTSFNTEVNDIIYAKVSLETLDKDSEVTKNGVVGGVSIDNTILDNRVQIETTKRKAIRLEINTTGGEGFVKIAYVHSNKRAVLTLDTIDLSGRLLSTIESLRYSGYLNAFDGDFTDGFYETNGGKPVPSSTVGEYHSVMTTNYISCLPNEKIKISYDGTLKRTSGATLLLLFYNKDKEFISVLGSGSSDNSYTFYVPANVYYFRFNVASDEPEMSIDVVGNLTVIRHYSSQVLPNGTVVSSNADFAEIGQWSDGNPDNEDRIGYFVSISKTEEGITMVKATSTSDVRGVTISDPAFSANASEDKFENENLKKEYDFVVSAGFGTVIDNGTCTVNERCIPDDNGCAVPSTNSMGYQVIERVDDTHVLILVEPNVDMLKRIKDDIENLDMAIVETNKKITTNLIKPTLQTTTSNGVTCTNNGDDGTYTLNGTATENTEFLLYGTNNLVELNKEFRLTGCPNNTDAYLFVGDWGSPWKIYGTDRGNGSNFKITTSSPDKRVVIAVPKGQTLDNIVFKPMLTSNLSATYDDFVKYTGDTGQLNSDVAKIVDGTTVVEKATHATTADNATKATSAGSATKATQDGNGNVISDTYATHKEIAKVLEMTWGSSSWTKSITLVDNTAYLLWINTSGQGTSSGLSFISCDNSWKISNIVTPANTVTTSISGNTLTVSRSSAPTISASAVVLSLGKVV